MNRHRTTEKTEPWVMMVGELSNPLIPPEYCHSVVPDVGIG